MMHGRKNIKSDTIKAVSKNCILMVGGGLCCCWLWMMSGGGVWC